MLAADLKPTDGQAAAQAAVNPSAAPKGSDSPTPQQQQASDAKTQPAELNGAAEQKPGDKPVETKAEAKVETKKANAPETYEFKAQQGQEFDAPVLKAYGDVARELDLSQEAAQKVLDKVAPVLHQRQIERIQAVRAEWTKAAEADPEFGGDALPASLKTANEALAKYGDPALLQLLNESGLSNHPAMIRAWRKVGLAVGDDPLVTGGQTQAEKDLAHRLNPSMK